MNETHEAATIESHAAEDVQGFFTPVPIPSARLTNLGSATPLSATRLSLPRTTLANEAGPANNPRPTPIGT